MKKKISPKSNQRMRNIQKNEAILTSQKDSEIFFNSIVNDVEPNTYLVTAVYRFNEL